MKKYLFLTLATFIVGLAVVSWSRGLVGWRLGLAEHRSDTLRLNADLGPGQTLWIRNFNGAVQVEPAPAAGVEILAVKRWRRSDPKRVDVRVVTDSAGVTVCAVWPGLAADCSPRGDYTMRGVRRNDVRVALVLRVPAGAKIDASTTNGDVSVAGPYRSVTAASVNGDVEVGGARGPVDARTTSGGVTIDTDRGPVQASAVNGGIHAAMRALEEPGDVVLQSVNGSVTVELPLQLDAELSASTVNGSIRTDFPVTVRGRMDPRSLDATLGRGGRKISLETVNGSIHVVHIGPRPVVGPLH